MFKALVLNKQDNAVTPRSRTSTRRGCPRATSRSQWSTRRSTTRTGSSSGTRRLSCAPIRTCRASTSRVACSSAHPDWRPGDAVVLTGWGVGERHWGGHAQRARVKGDWLVPLPAGWRTEHAMAVGTAGFTAMLAVLALENHGLSPATARFWSRAPPAGRLGRGRGSRQARPSGDGLDRATSHDYLRALGATAFIDRAELAEPSSRPLESERFAGCIDAVGGTTLAQVLAQMKYRCSVAAVGLAGGSELRHGDPVPAAAIVGGNRWSGRAAPRAAAMASPDLVATEADHQSGAAGSASPRRRDPAGPRAGTGGGRSEPVKRCHGAGAARRLPRGMRR